MTRRRSLLEATILIVGVVILSGHAWGETLEIPVTGLDALTTVDPGVQFTDAEGITHYRGLVQVATIEGQDEDGVPVTGVGYYVHNINIDLATGDGDVNSKLTTQLTYGDLEGDLRGTADMAITGFVAVGSFVYPRGSGAFAGWHMRGSVTGIFGALLNSWDGVFQIPGGEKAAVEAETWSAVKGLFR